MDSGPLDELAGTMALGQLFQSVRQRWGAFELVDHWKQGEFHHDVVLRIPDPRGELPGEILLVSTNCNGGVKEVLSLADVPDRFGLWRHRCPDNLDFRGKPPTILASSRTTHWFDPCELLSENARSELRPEFRVRQRGGGWKQR